MCVMDKWVGKKNGDFEQGYASAGGEVRVKAWRATCAKISSAMKMAPSPLVSIIFGAVARCRTCRDCSPLRPNDRMLGVLVQSVWHRQRKRCLP